MFKLIFACATGAAVLIATPLHATPKRHSGVRAGPAARHVVEVENGALAYVSSDGGATEFLDLSIDCNGVSVSMKDFLPMRVAQAHAAGLAQTYRVESEVTHGKTLVSVLEATGRVDGKELTGIPTLVTYQYVIDWPNARFVGQEPRGVSQNPLGFMEDHWDAICSGYFAKHHLYGSGAR